mgnify:CR=1 FL=1
MTWNEIISKSSDYLGTKGVPDARVAGELLAARLLRLGRGMLAGEGIDVSVICPGFVRSRITDRNTCPMPFFMEADKAARIILSRADRNVGLIAFPWPMRLATWWLSTLPFRLNEFVNSLLPAKTTNTTPTPF